VSRNNLICAVFIALLLMPFAHAAQAGQVLPRTIYAIYHSKYEGDPRFTRMHEYIEMPLNHMGFKLEYIDMNERKEMPMPNSDVYGAVVFFSSDTLLENPDTLWKWLGGFVDSGHKLLILGNLGLSTKYRERPENVALINSVLNRIGVQDLDLWVGVTYESTIAYKNPSLVGFERSFEGGLPSYMHTIAVGKDATSHLKVVSHKQYEQEADLIVTTPRGGYVSDGYAYFEKFDDNDDLILRQWYINPFLLLEMVFGREGTPVADTTTLLGKRIFYSHIDGDGWNNLYEGVEKVPTRPKLAAEILYDEVYSKYQDLYFTVAPIVSEIDISCYGVPGSMEIAKQTFKLPNVEPGSHTWSHPLLWEFFADGDIPEKEKRFLNKYPEKPYQRLFVSDWIKGNTEEKKAAHFEYTHKSRDMTKHDKNPLKGLRNPFREEEDIWAHYDTPRSYACEDFSLDREIQGSVDYIEKLTDGKKVKLYQWSGDTSPFEEAIAETREAGLYNINGGDSRFDNEFPSYATVAPIGVIMGKERQIYSSNSNENNYTDLWTDRFFGFRYLRETVLNTETPIRIDPFNVYFHTYSGQKIASLNAVHENLNLARSQDIIPVFTSQYAGIANSFYTIDFEKLGENRWKVRNRGEVQTIRFDRSVLKEVDFSASQGVIGARHFQSSLYVSLDPSIKEPILQLRPRTKLGQYAVSTTPYIIESSWQISGWENSKNTLTFKAFGPQQGEILLYLPTVKGLDILVKNSKGTVLTKTLINDNNNAVSLSGLSSEEPVTVTVTMDGPGE
jgi:polysaccharide biosynthesis protein PelA